MDAVIRSGGKQYRVHEGSIFNVATVGADEGSRLELRDILLVSDGDKVTLGDPTVPDAVVVAEVLQHGKGRKVVNFKYKAKVRYRRKRGHRQGYTRLAVREIRLGGAAAAERPAAVATEAGGEADATEAPRRRRRAAATEE